MRTFWLWAVVVCGLVFLPFDVSAKPYLWKEAKKHPYFGNHPSQWAKLVKLVMANREMYMAHVKPVPTTFGLPDYNKKRVLLKRWRGNILLLTRWATWCAPCKDGLRRKRLLASWLQTRRIINVGVAHQRFKDIANYHQMQPPSAQFAISLVDVKGETLPYLPGAAYPTTAIIDPWGWTWAHVRLRGTWDSKPYKALFKFVLALPYGKVSNTPSSRPSSVKTKAPASRPSSFTK